MTLLQLHFFAASAWLGLMAAESVLELHDAYAAAGRGTIAAVHRWIDLLAEGPLVTVVLITGAVLLARDWPPSPLLLFKVGCGLAAIAANAVCIGWVLARAKATDDARKVALTRKIKLSGAAIPLAIVAFAIGVGYLPGR
jgi:hypothetical protein